MEYSKELPSYTRGEERFSGISHMAGGGLAIAGFVLGLVIACIFSDGYGIASMLVYGISMIIMYSMSAIYHFLHTNLAKKIFRIFDHCSIFFLIAGTYTPYCLITLREVNPFTGWLLFSIVWGCAILGVVGNAINMHHPVIKVLSMVAYIAMGWCVILEINTLMSNLETWGFLLLLFGGIAYTIGAIFYGFGKKAKYIHSVWHLFVLAGTILQYLSILFYVIL